MLTTLLLSVLAHAADSCPDAPVPGDAWTDHTALAAQLAPDAIAALEAYAFSPDLDEETREGVRTDGLVIVRDGAILYERYRGDWNRDRPHLLWSASKNFTASLTGIAVKRHDLDIDASICDHVEVVNPDACQITPRDLMEMSSGFAWRESYEGQSPRVSSVVNMLFGEGRKDVLAFVTSHELRDPPGTSYYYSSGDTNVLSAVNTAILREAHGERYPWTLLFEPLGITTATFERDAKGVPIGSSYLYMTPRDMARYGLFLLHDGCWDGERLLPEGWVAKASSPAESLHGRIVLWEPAGNAGWNTWVNEPAPWLGETEPPWTGAPRDTFGALGHWKQAIYVVPSENLVVARTGDDRDGESYQPGELVRLAVAVANEVPPIEVNPTVFEPPGGEGGEGGEGEGDGEFGGIEGVVEPEPETDGEPEAEAPETGPPPVDPAARWARETQPAAAEGTPFAEPPKKYPLGLLKIASGYAARQACSCLFVSGRTEEDCRAYIKVSPDVARIKIDWEERFVRAKSLGMGKVVARHVGSEEGCIIE